MVHFLFPLSNFHFPISNKKKGWVRFPICHSWGILFFPTCGFATLGEKSHPLFLSQLQQLIHVFGSKWCHMIRLGNEKMFGCPFEKTQIIHLYCHKSWIWHRLKHIKTKLKIALSQYFKKAVIDFFFRNFMMQQQFKKQCVGNCQYGIFEPNHEIAFLLPKC